MELTVRICVSLKWRQEAMIKARSRFKRLHGQDMEDQFGQELGRETVPAFLRSSAIIYLSGTIEALFERVIGTSFSSYAQLT